MLGRYCFQRFLEPPPFEESRPSTRRRASRRQPKLKLKPSSRLSALVWQLTLICDCSVSSVPASTKPFLPAHVTSTPFRGTLRLLNDVQALSARYNIEPGFCLTSCGISR